MQNTINQRLRNDYTNKFCLVVQDLVTKRKNLHINQNTMAVKCGVSLRTIQNFENYKCDDYFLVFAYRELLKL